MGTIKSGGDVHLYKTNAHYSKSSSQSASLDATAWMTYRIKKIVDSRLEN